MHDPEFGPYFGAEDLARGSDVPADVIEQTRADEAAQVKQAVGVDDDDSIVAFSGGFLGSLIHQVNMVHGMLERMGEPLPPAVTGGDAWAGGQALAGSARLSNGARWDSAWIQLLDMHEYEESIRLYFADAVRTLADPVAVAAPVAERLLDHDGRRRRTADGAVRVVRGGLPARARALPPVHARRRGVPHAAGPGAHRPGRPDRDVPQARRGRRPRS